MLYNGQKLQISYLDHIVQLLKDCRHDEAADAAEEEAEGEEELRGGGGRGQLVEDGGGEERGGRGHEVHHEGHHHPVQVQPELLLQEIFTRILNIEYLRVPQNAALIINLFHSPNSILCDFKESVEIRLI